MNQVFDDINNIATVEIELASEQVISKQILVRGKFNILYEQNGLMVKGSDVLKHIVLVVTRGGNHFADAPYRDVIVFEDDIIETDKGCSGRFNFNVFEKVGFNGAGDYYIMCSLGTVTSNIIYAAIDAK